MRLITKHNLNRFLLFVLVAVSGFELSAQSKCANGYLSIPDKFDNYNKKTFLDQIYNNKIDLRELNSTGSRQSYCWVVYSDRDDNSLYYTIDGMQRIDKLSFMERLNVKEVRGNWLLVYSQVLNKDGIEKQNVERGWIKAENLILSNKAALLNDKSSTKKAMILVSLSNLDPSTMSTFKNELEDKKFYDRPSSSSTYENGKKANKFRIYYILKETQNMVLLSSSDKLTGSTEVLSKRVAGWMLKLNITNWDHKVCLEPNYGKDAVKDYGDREIPIFTDNLQYIKDYISNGDYTTSKSHIIKNINIEIKRKDPLIMRMPILDTDSNQPNIKKVASIARMENESGKAQDNAVNTKKQLDRLKNAVNNVDIMFVVDATMSMSRYYSAIKRSIQNIISKNKLTGANTKFRFGIAIYRDYADGDEAFEIQPLTSDYNAVLSKVSTTVCRSKDFDIPEAQYQGLIKGIKQAGFNKEHSNVVVLIGDAGNHSPDPNGYKVADVVAQMNTYNINLIAFQVIAGNDDSFDKFNWDAQDYLYDAAKSRFNDNTTSLEAKLTKISTNINNTYKLTYGNEKNDEVFMMFGRFTYATGNSAMSTKILEQNIISSTSIYISKIQKKIGLLENLSDGEGDRNGEFTDGLIGYLKRMGFTEDQIKFLINQGEVSSKGQTSIKYFNKSTDCFYPVVFLSADEKNTIDKMLKKLIRSWGGVASKKKALKNALIQQAMDLLGAPKDVVENKTMNDIWDIILGVPFRGDPIISKKTLKDLDKLDDNIFKPFYDNFRRDAEKFTEKPFYDSMFEMKGQRFYWIPLNKFPGND